MGIKIACHPKRGNFSPGNARELTHGESYQSVKKSALMRSTSSLGVERDIIIPGSKSLGYFQEQFLFS